MKNHLCEKDRQQNIQSKFGLGCKHTINYYVLTSHGIIRKKHANNAGSILYGNVSAEFIIKYRAHRPPQ